ncbi:restriction endonuclease subunit S [Pseudomonas sp. 1928-m]|uniref:restriction endonuclease subunit S n=1 Tax=Pseudomonas sp. 1928-m TaxID=3033804 RepID=UPI0023DEC3EB|nr:restriction endonuclease subunit S [Pseudomonas sp. 1928-m]MDF3195612.1 restriction endonuclease subunit S [Pseudomonas sp. 1928-m]
MSVEWTKQKLSSLGTFDRGKSKHRPRDAAHLYGGPYPFIQTGDVTAAGGRITSYRQTYTEAGLAQSKLWPVGTLCITIAANIAETALLTFPACFPDSVVGFTAEPSKADIRYIEYVFRAFRDSVKQRAYGSVQENINLEVLRDLEFPIPPLQLQKSIADFLTLFDDHIALLHETNATLEAIAQALFKSWFVDFDPVRAKAEGRQPQSMDAATAALFPDSFEESELGLVPKGWLTRPIYDMATYINGAAYKAFEPNAERRGLPIIKIAELKAGVGVQTAFSDVAMPVKYLIETGDILFSWSGNPDTSIDTFVWQHAPALLNQHIFRVLPHETFERSFVLQMLRNLKPVFAELARNKQTTGLGHVTVADLKRLHVVHPPQSVIEQFNILVVPIHQMIFGNEQQAQTLTQLRDTLLPRLISGQLRLPEAEKLAEQAVA